MFVLCAANLLAVILFQHSSFISYSKFETHHKVTEVAAGSMLTVLTVMHSWRHYANVPCYKKETGKYFP